MKFQTIMIGLSLLIANCGGDRLNLRNATPSESAITGDAQIDSIELSLAGDLCSEKVNFTYEGYRLLQALRINDADVVKEAIDRMQLGFDSCSALSTKLEELKRGFIETRSTLQDKPYWCNHQPFNGNIYACAFFSLGSALHNYSVSIETGKCAGQALLQSSRALLHGVHLAHFSAFRKESIWKLQQLTSAHEAQLNHYAKLLSDPDISRAAWFVALVKYYVDQFIRANRSPTERDRLLYAELLTNARVSILKSKSWNPSCR